MSGATHIVKAYSQELQRLRDLMAEMGGLVENQVALATRAIVEGDPALATRAIEQDPSVDALERQAEQLVITMLALRQPMAADLRAVVAALKITAALERIGAELEAAFVRPGPAGAAQAATHAPAREASGAERAELDVSLERQLLEDGIVVRGHDVARVVGLMTGRSVEWEE